MQITVSGKQIDVGEALRAHVERNLSAAVSKYFDRPVDGHVVFSRRGHEFICDSSVHLPTGLTAQAHGTSADVYAAFEQAAERIEKQLRRHKRRLKDHHQARKTPIEMTEAASYVLRGYDEDAGEESEAVNGNQPVIVAEMTMPVKTLTVGEAVMQMELAHAAFLLFRNDASGRINIVYQRDDGNVGWVDPANLPES
jgi:ribosomal subunit interface protein